jgi:hypothetical protein
VQTTTMPTTRRRRPRAVTFVASLLLIEAVLVILAGIVTGSGIIATGPIGQFGPDDVFGPLFEVVPGLGLATAIVVVGGGMALAGLGLLQVEEWGWILAMAFQGLGLANALYAHLQGDRQYVALGLCSFVVLVLNQREVRQIFAARIRND